MKKAQPEPQIIPGQLYQHPIDIKNLLTHLTKTKTRDEIKIVYFGTPQFSAYILEKLIEFCQNPNQDWKAWKAKKFEVQTVITRPDKPVGRQQTIRPSSVSLVAKKYGIPTLKPVKLSDEEFLKDNQALLQADLFVVASYGKIIPQSLLDIPKSGSLNVHPSLLPKYRGPSPILTPILNGEKQTGVTIMLMDAEMDHGPILNTSKISISEEDTHQSLSNKLSHNSAPLLISTLVKFVEGKIKPKKQNHSKATFTKLIKKEDSYFDISSPPDPETLDRMIRAYYPWPGVWTRWGDKIIKFLPGGLIQMEGKKATPFKDFLNGYPDFPLKIL